MIIDVLYINNLNKIIYNILLLKMNYGIIHYKMLLNIFNKIKYYHLEMIKINKYNILLIGYIHKIQIIKFKVIICN